jgi:hypothetical protein
MYKYERISRYILNEVETCDIWYQFGCISFWLFLLRKAITTIFILTIATRLGFFHKTLSNRIIQFTCNAVNTHLNHRRIYLLVWGRYCACEILMVETCDIWYQFGCISFWLFLLRKAITTIFILTIATRLGFFHNLTESYSLHVMQLIRI